MDGTSTSAVTGNPLDVSLYASHAAAQSFDVANVFPIEALGNDYYVLSDWGNNNGNWSAEALIVATEDNTTIEISPTCLLDDQSQTDDFTCPFPNNFK